MNGIIIFQRSKFTWQVSTNMDLKKKMSDGTKTFKTYGALTKCLNICLQLREHIIDEMSSVSSAERLWLNHCPVESSIS